MMNKKVGESNVSAVLCLLLLLRSGWMGTRGAPGEE